MSAKLRIVTWNIHKGIGTDRAYRLDRTVEVLKAIDADVVCLQEVDQGVRRSDFDCQRNRLRDELGYEHAALGLNVKVQKGMYGNLTLARHPLEEVENVDLTIPPKKCRSGLVTRVLDGHGSGWLLANVHLGLMHLERKIQAKRLLAHMLQREPIDQPLIIAGDWNEWTTRLVRNVMTDHKFEVARCDLDERELRTWPSRRPIVALDKVLFRGPVLCHRVKRVVNDITRVASDHLPLVVELESTVTPAT